jgi:hypothetical protein
VRSFGEADHAPAIAVTMRDVRCAMVNFDPDGGRPEPEVLKAVVRANQNHAGIYGTSRAPGGSPSDRASSSNGKRARGERWSYRVSTASRDRLSVAIADSQSTDHASAANNRDADVLVL